MTTELKQLFSTTLSVNPYAQNYKVGTSNSLETPTAPEYEKKQFSIAYLNSRNFINAQIEISKNIPDEDLLDAINNKAYDELGLDQAIEYQIKYVEFFTHLDEENRYFHIFIVDPIIIEETYEKISQQIKYIDVIIPTPLLFKSLYSTRLIDENGAHCFIYVQEDDAFVTLYNNKEYVYTKSIKHSLQNMHERFCELYGQHISYQEFTKFITTQVLRDSKSPYVEFFIRLYQELFTTINEVLTYIKRAYELEKIDRIYIDFQIPTKTKIHELVEVELNIRASDFNFNFGYGSQHEFVDHLHALMQIYPTLDENQRYDCNFTIYERPPKFIKRDSGKVLMLIAASFIVAFAYPIAYWSLTYLQVMHLDSLEKEYAHLHKAKIIREANIKKRLANKAKALKILEYERKEYASKRDTLIQIHNIQVDYPMKAKMIALLTKDLTKFHVQLNSLQYSEDTMVKKFNFHLVSNSDKSITNLVKYLTKAHANKFTFSLNEIIYNASLNKYVTELKVKLL